MEFNIICREPIWLQKNKTYTFTYQQNGEPTRYKIEMLYVGSGIYYFMEHSLKTKEWHESKEARDEFIKQIGLWSKGGSYRKLHPVVTTYYEDLKEKRNQLENQIEELDKEIKKVKDEEDKRQYNEYISDSDIKSLHKFHTDLNKLIDKEYCLRRVYYNGIEYLTVYDKKNNKHRAVANLYDDQIEFTDLPIYLINYLK